MNSSPATSDLCDAYGDRVRVVALLRDFGARKSFCGTVVTLKVFEDNALVRAALEEPGHGKVLVVDAGGSLRCALIGDQMAALAQQNGWEGIVLFGCIRDSEAVAGIDVGLKALATCPRRSLKNGGGERDVPVSFGGVTFAPGEWLAADADGIVVAEQVLELP